MHLPFFLEPQSRVELSLSPCHLPITNTNSPLPWSFYAAAASDMIGSMI